MTRIPAGAGALVGREAALDQLRQVAWGRGPTGRTLLVTGTPGSGRTAVVASALEGFPGDVLWFSGNSASGPEPWAALRNARGTVGSVTGFAAGGGDDLVAETLAGRLQPDELGRRMAALYRSLPRRPGPVVLVADDIHRCDASSLALLVFLAHVNHTFDVSYLLTCPDDALPEAARDLPRLVLDPLREAAAREALQAWTGQPVATEVAGALAHLTDGNPRVLREVAGQLDPEQLAGRRSLPVRLPVPAAGAAVVAPALQGLDDEELRAVACFHLGLPVPVVVLEHVTGLGPVGALVDRNVLEAVPGGFRCTSPLLARVAETRLDRAARRELAGALATAWSALDPVRSALHAADEGLPTPEVLELGRRALAGPAARGGASDDRLAEALAWAVVARADPPTTRDWLNLTDRAERAGHLADARDAFERAVRAPAVDEDDLALLTRQRGFLSQVADDRTLAVPSTKLLASLELVRPAVVFETITRTAWNSLLVGAHEQARAHLDRARQASRAARATDRALWRLVDVAWQRATSGTRAETLREAALRWRDSADDREWYDDFLLVTTLVEAHAYAEARQHLFAAGSAHRDAGRLARHFLLAARLQVEVATAAVATALGTAEELARTAVAGPVHVRGLDPALVRLETLAGLPEGTLLARRGGFASESSGVAWARAERDLVEGRYPEAAVALRALLQLTPSLPVEARRLVLADLVEAHVATGDLGAAQEAYARAVPEEPAGHGADAAAARAAALVASPFETRSAFARAIAVAETGSGLLERARTLLALSRRLGATGAEEEAERLRDEAALLFAHHGAEGWSRHARQAVPPPQDPGAQDRLLNTRLDDQEADIVRLLLLGQKNKEVAARLYVSLRSLEKSLTRIYAKTGVASKAQLLALVRAEGVEREDRPGPRSATG